MSEQITVQHDDRQAILDPGTSAITALKALDAVHGQVVAATVNGEEWDLDRTVPDGAEVAAVRADTEQGRAILRHSVAHLMAQAVTDLFPEAKWAIGPPVENGFYYDFDVARPFSGDDLERIEARMHDLIRERQSFVREELSQAQARELFSEQPYKREIIERVADGTSDQDAGAGPAEFTVYRNVRPDGEEAWVDLCRGPHIPSSERVPAFKLLRTAGAYWRGREDQPMLQRIYGTAWESRKALTAHLTRLEEAATRDHRRLGRELELTCFPEELGPGLSIFLPKGALVRKQMEDWIRDEVLARGYDAVYTPHIAKEQLWRISGHLENYQELMYPAMQVDTDEDGDGGAAYRLKPMNCPFHILVYGERIRSYRDLPLRLSELGTVYRYERSGVVNGQLRARGFTQDDSHIFCRPDQLVDEVEDCVNFARDLYRDFGFGNPSRVAISTRPAKSIGADDGWQFAERALQEAVERTGLPYEIDEGEGAFYGPKIDIHLRDAIGREWQTTTVQADVTLPERFDLSYVDDHGQRQRPLMVHRALFGSIERFFAVLVESCNGAFPTWLAPVQAVVLPVSADVDTYADDVARTLRAGRVRVDVDVSDDTLGNKIRRAQTSKVPYSLIVGSDESQTRTVSVRPYQGEQRKGVDLELFTDELVAEIAHRGQETG